MPIPYEHPYREVVVVWGPVYNLRVSSFKRVQCYISGGKCLYFLSITLLYVDAEAGPNEGRLHHWLTATVLNIPNHSPSTHSSGRPSSPVLNHPWLAASSFCFSCFNPCPHLSTEVQYSNYGGCCPVMFP